MKRYRERRTKRDCPDQEIGQVGLVLRDLLIHRGQGQIGVDHAQHLPAGGMFVAGGVRTFRSVRDRLDYRQHALAFLIGESARPIFAVQGAERCGLLVASVAGLRHLIYDAVDFSWRPWNK